MAKSEVRKWRGRKKKAPVYRGLLRKRVNGFEPSTFTLATCSPTVDKPCENREMCDSKDSATAEKTAADVGETAGDDLRVVIETWNRLPAYVRQTVLTLVSQCVEPKADDTEV